MTITREGIVPRIRVACSAHDGSVVSVCRVSETGRVVSVIWQRPCCAVDRPMAFVFEGEAQAAASEVISVATLLSINNRILEDSTFLEGAATPGRLADAAQASPPQSAEPPASSRGLDR